MLAALDRHRRRPLREGLACGPAQFLLASVGRLNLDAGIRLRERAARTSRCPDERSGIVGTSRGIVDHVEANGTIEGAPGLQEVHLPVFDCAFRAAAGVRSIHHMGHVKMMAAAQPFVSGAISKTVNVPEDATVAEIEETYLHGWKLGLKAIAIYRDNSKRTQPLSTGKKAAEAAKAGCPVSKLFKGAEIALDASLA